MMLRTNIEIDEALVNEAMRLTQLKTKKELVNYAIKELVQKARRRKILELEGKIDWTSNLAEMRKSRL
jgi:Arc/MetJ family transcription regulator